MATRRDYGPFGRLALQAATARGLITDDSFATYLGAVTGEAVDRSLVAQWRSGATHAPFDVLIHLADHIGQGGVELVFGPVLRERGFSAGALPSGSLAPVSVGRVAVEAVQRSADLLGDAHRALEDGEVSPAEAEQLLRHVDPMTTRLAELGQQLRQVAGARRPR